MSRILQELTAPLLAPYLHPVIPSHTDDGNDINDDDHDDNGEEADGFTSQKLFSFAWQIAKGMVGINIANQK